MTRLIFPIFLLLIFHSKRGLSDNDSIPDKKNIVKLGLNGYHDPYSGTYHILPGPSIFFQMDYLEEIRNFSYERLISRLISAEISFNTYRENFNNCIVLDRKEYNNLINTRELFSSTIDRGRIYSIGINMNHFYDFSSKLTVNSKGALFYQINQQHWIYTWKKEGSYFFNQNPGFKIQISEDFIFRNRFVAGFNAGWNQFLKTKKEHSYPKHYGFFSNAFYLGVKF